jgi:dipeptidyl aminopeptidase/acylaminoacyl peptidase
LHGLQIAVPRWSPDGKAIAFIGGLMSDQGPTGGDAWIVAATGGQPVNLTAQRPTSPAWIEWDGDEHIYMNELAGGASQLVRIQLQGDRSSQNVATSFAPPVLSIPGSVGDGQILAATRKPPKDGPTHWRCHKLAAALGVSSDALHGAWQRRA